MDSPDAPQALPVHEFPQGTMLLGDWKNTHLAYLRGHTTQRRPLTQSVVHRMHHLHVSRVRWYKTTPSTFELASGSQWDSAADGSAEAVDRGAQDPLLPVQHQHHHLVAEVALPVSPGEDAVAPTTVPVAVQGYLTIEGSCSPSLAEFRRTPSHPHTSHTFVNVHPSRIITTDVPGLRSLGSLDPLSSFANASPIDVEDLTPTRRNAQRSDITPTRPPKGVDVPSPLSAKATELFEYPTSPQAPSGSSSLIEEHGSHVEDVGESLDAVPARLDFSYLTKNSNSAPGSSSPLFISPFASRSSSIASRSAVSRSSTDSVRSQANSRSNSSNATSFSTSSGFSLSSAGLRFSENPLNRIAGTPPHGMETRFLVSYPGTDFAGFEAQPSPASQGTDDREECVLELSFPPPTVSSPHADEPRGFLTLRDFTILADLVERSLKSENEDEYTDTQDDDDDGSEDSDASDESGDTDPMDIDAPPTLAAPHHMHASATCCCEYFRRLFNLIPLVSGLRATTNEGPKESLSPLPHSTALGQLDQVDQSHYEVYSHHGRYLSATANLQSDGRVEETARLRAVFERRRARHEEQLLQIVRPRYFYNSTTNPSPISTHDTTAAVPLTALEEARLADERFRRAAEDYGHPASRSVDVNEVEADRC